MSVSEAKETSLTIRVHDEDGELWAEVVELPGCFASGDTIDELRASLREAVGLYLDIAIVDDAWGNPKVTEHEAVFS